MTAAASHTTPLSTDTLSCPSCGQPIPELKRLVDEAVRMRLAELAATFEAEHAQAVARIEDRPEHDAEELASAHARHAEIMDHLRMAMRQF